MKLYVKASSSYTSSPNNFDVKKELKTKYKLDTRRQDGFIHLAVYGAQLLKDKTFINPDDELYITSGVGNVDVLQKTNIYVTKEKKFIKPFDFINMLGNTTSYYVANSLGMKDKNTFQISNNFTFINTLISVFASLQISKKEAILGAVDLSTEPQEVIQRVLGVDEKQTITSSVNYQKLSLSPHNAIAQIEFGTKIYSLEEINKIIEQSNLKIVCSSRCEKIYCLKDKDFFETMGSYYINKAIENKQDILYVECFKNDYKVIKIVNLL